MRPGHFWACELGDADGTGSPILHTFTKKNEYAARPAAAPLHTLPPAARGDQHTPPCTCWCCCCRYFTLSNGVKVRGDAGECLLLLRRYYHRVAEDAQGLTFKRQEPKKGEIFVVNSSELRAVQGHQKNDFILNPINPPKQREQKSRSAKGAKQQELVYPAGQEWALDAEVDMDTRRVCEAS